MIFNRLEEASKRLSKDRQSKLEIWESKRDEIDKMIDHSEREIELHDIVEEDLPAVRKQCEEFNVSKILLRNKDNKAHV